jgi:hypothetical protein
LSGASPAKTSRTCSTVSTTKPPETRPARSRPESDITYGEDHLARKETCRSRLATRSEWTSLDRRAERRRGGRFARGERERHGAPAAVELVDQAREMLIVNPTEELLLEALAYRLARALH